MKKAIVSLFLGCGAFVSTARAAVHTVTDFSAIGGMSTNAVVCVVGDTVTLPEGTTYTVNNSRVASIDGTTVTALEEGFTGIIDGNSNVGGLIVRPQPAGSGRVFVAILATDATLGTGNTVNLNWCDADSWMCLDGGSGYPNAADDVAIIPVSVSVSDDNAKNNYSATRLIFGSDVVVGQVFMGSFNTGALNFQIYPNGTDATVTFSRTDGKDSLFMVTGNAASSHNTWVRFMENNSHKLSFSLSGGLVVDLGYVDYDSGSTISHFLFHKGSLSVPSGSTLTFVNGKPGHSGSNAEDSGVEFNTDFALGGAGTIRNDSDMNMRVESEGDAIFGGTWVSGGKRGTTLGSAPVGAGIDFRKATAEGCTATSDGAFSIESNWGAWNATAFQYLGSGGIKIGSTANNYGSCTGIDFYPDRIRTASHVVLNSGLLGIWPEYNKNVTTWGSEVITTRVDRLTLGYGLNKLYFWGTATGNVKGTSNFVDIVSVDQQNRAQAYVFSTEFWGAAEASALDTSNVRSRIQDAASLATNGVIPWMGIIARKKGLLPGLVDEDGFLYTEALVSGVMLRNATAGGNALVHSASLSLTSDLTVNSLSVGSTSGKDRFLGADYTLTITSGALYLWDGSSVVGVEGGSNNGRIVFGAPAYIHTIVSTNSPAQINLPLVAQHGAAFGAPGGVLVTGDQTGIEEELAVNGCRLVLGSSTTAAELDVDIRVSGGNSVLDVENVNSGFLKGHTLTLQDSGNYPARVILASNTTYRVGTLYVGGKKMKSGTYGSSDSDAAKVDDEHFSGPGMLEVAGIGLTVIVR